MALFIGLRQNNCTGAIVLIVKGFYLSVAMKLLLFLLLMLMLSVPAKLQAQTDYTTALGLRLSPFYGFTVKHFLNNEHAVEGLLHTRWNAFKITGLYEVHKAAFDEPGLYVYFGGGAHLGVANKRYYGRDYPESRGVLGLDGILGLEYNIQERDIPLNLSLDWKPVFNLAPYSGLFGSEAALSVRYMIKR